MDSTRSFENENHRIFWGNALQVLEHHIPDSSIDLIFADPPYNIGKQFGDFADRWESDVTYAKWCEAWLELCVQKLKPTGSMYVMTSTQAMPHIDLFLRSRMTILSRIVWHYDSSGVQAKQKFGSMYEPILHCVKDSKRYTFNASEIEIPAPTGAKRKLIDYRKVPPVPYNTSKVPGNVWYFPRVRYRMAEYEEHPTQKPEALLERIIRASSNTEDWILDPFAGSFTTSAVADRLQRRSIGIELHQAFVEIGLRRLKLATELDGKQLDAPKKQLKTRKSSSKNESS